LGTIVAYSVAVLTATLDIPTSPIRTRRILCDGVVVGMTNPKLAAIRSHPAQFADPARGHLPPQLLVFGLVCVGIALVCDVSWALLAAAARSWLGRSPRRLSALASTAEVIMIGLGAQLALTGRRD
jgi:threonine/homoserine/homoserine lactone efflux protein